MEQMTQANEQQLEQKKITKKELSKAFWIYQLGCELSNSYERLQSLVFCASMIPAIKKLYADDEEQQREALKRHLNFFNTEGTVGASIQGIAIAMEEEKSNGNYFQILKVPHCFLDGHWCHFVLSFLVVQTNLLLFRSALKK